MGTMSQEKSEIGLRLRLENHTAIKKIYVGINNTFVILSLIIPGLSI